MEVHAASTRARHINTSLDGENRHGNCEEGRSGQKGRPGEESRSGEEGGTRQEGRSGEEGRSRQEGGPGQEGCSREEGRSGQEAHPERCVHEGDDPQRCAGRDHRRQGRAAHRGDQEVWEYIKKNGLQDKAKKTMINADAKLKEIFKKAQVSMFEMTKLINSHLS
jgi:hypothetical protein